ncbi:DUF2256 domain-containing protein [Pannonibacter phragmitetus]|uniref:DUF2256 domain-containing protein n=1 Tax=Pannonibacter phragmitetus TaxID=121719 RepID=UPI000F452386|nr:DUF2256 domain-containing protein [Pannonibacter phragmitetus]MBA4206591.1 DUF2256 domain-containing protein [Polymorphum sp.]
MKMRKKSDLPVKTCRTCARPFTWRRKWARDWDNVLYCSDRCRSTRNNCGPLAEEPEEEAQSSSRRR